MAVLMKETGIGNAMFPRFHFYRFTSAEYNQRTEVKNEYTNFDAIASHSRPNSNAASTVKHELRRMAQVGTRRYRGVDSRGSDSNGND
jgi:hypothetical protein